MKNSIPSSRWLWVPVAIVIAILGLTATPGQLMAQGDKSVDYQGGTSWVIAFPDTTMNTFDSRYPNRRFEDKAFIWIYSPIDNKVSIRGEGYIQNNKLLPGGTFTIIDLMDASQRAPQPIVTESGRVMRNTFTIQSESPIVIYCYLLTKFGTEAWTPIPVESWGTEYYAGAQAGEVAADVSPGGEFDYNKKNKMAPAEILVVAAYDDTRITIVPNSPLLDNPPTNNVRLNAGEAYQVQSYVDTLTRNQGKPQPDLAGSRIFSTKPIGVVTGNTRAQVTGEDEIGLGKNSWKNMLIEWLTPIDQHGSEFVYLPTWDERRPMGIPGEKLEDKRKAEFVRIYGTQPGTTTGSYIEDGATRPLGSIQQGRFEQLRLGTPIARVFKTNQPAQAMMNSSATVKFSGTTAGWGGYIGLQYDGWGAYMVEMTPREQWTSFAPYYASVQPTGMENFLNIVTDTSSASKIMTETGAPVIFNRGVIAGTDLIWGSMSVTPGRDHYIEGRDGAKFYAFAYGLYRGHEEYRPGRVRDDNDDPSLASGGKTGGSGKDDDELLHPSEYEEYLGVAYGYPLAPIRLVVGPGDSLLIDTLRDCEQLTISIQTINANPVGLRSVLLENANNAKIDKIDPFPVTKATRATIIVAPINKNADATGTIVIMDRTGKTWRIPYTYYPDKLELTPTDLLDFGKMTAGEFKTLPERLKNIVGRDVIVTGVRLVRGNQGFSITSPTAFPFPIGPNQTSDVQVQANPPLDNREYIDTLVIETECNEFRVIVRAETGRPCVQVNDLRFGILRPNQEGTQVMRICNSGDGTLTFRAPFIDWPDKIHFTIEQSEIDKLDTAELDKDECIDIAVRFSSPDVNIYDINATIFSNGSPSCSKDISNWRATVNEPGPEITDYDWKKRWLTTLNSCTKSGIAQYDTVVFVRNSGTQNFLVDRIELRGADADSGYFQLGDDPKVGAGQLIRPTDDPNQWPQQVIFRPKDERVYNCDVVLITQEGEEVVNTLTGEGIETHIDVTPMVDYGRIQVGVNPPTTVTKTVTVRSLPTRPLTITNWYIDPADPAWQIVSTNPAVTLPTTLQPNDQIVVTVNYTPTVGGYDTVQFKVEGDYSSCDQNWFSVLTGAAYTIAAEATDLNISEIVSCFNDDGTITLRNSSPIDTLILTNYVIGGDQEIVVTGLSRPDTIAPNGSRTYQVLFTPDPSRTASYSATVTFSLETMDGSFTVPDVTSRITASARTILVSAHVDDTYSGLPGSQWTIPITLDQPLDDAQVDDLMVSLEYHQGMMLAQIDIANLQSLLNGTILDGKGWTIDLVKHEPNQQDPNMMVLTLRLRAPAGSNLEGAGALVNIPFVAFVGTTTSTPLPLRVYIDNRPCVTVQEIPGAAAVDSVCGLNFRLIEAFPGASYALDQNSPNPFNPSTKITFSLGLDAQTSLVIYNESGQKVATLVDGYLTPGTYEVTWDAAAFSSGLYYYRLTSGAWSRTNAMMLTK